MQNRIRQFKELGTVNFTLYWKVLVFYCFDYDSFPPKFSTCGRKTSINGFQFSAQNGICFFFFFCTIFSCGTELYDISETGNKFSALKKFRNSWEFLQMQLFTCWESTVSQTICYTTREVRKSQPSRLSQWWH